VTEPSEPSQEKHPGPKQFDFAVHEIGHAALLPPGIWTHSSLLPVSACPACIAEEEKDDKLGMSGESGGHTLYRGAGPRGYHSIIYSLAGGAAEVASGIDPKLMYIGGLGEYPDGMGSDFEVLRGDFSRHGAGTLEESADVLRILFDIAVSHLAPHAEKLREIAKRLVEKRLLKEGEVDFSFIEYAILDEIISVKDDPSPT
jgi:hypothetical protein